MELIRRRFNSTIGESVRRLLIMVVRRGTLDGIWRMTRQLDWLYPLQAGNGTSNMYLGVVAVTFILHS